MTCQRPDRARRRLGDTPTQALKARDARILNVFESAAEMQANIVIKGLLAA